MNMRNRGILLDSLTVEDTMVTEGFYKEVCIYGT